MAYVIGRKVVKDGGEFDSYAYGITLPVKNGNGGFFAAAAKNPKVKQVLQTTDYVQIIGVDNIINKILDPVFIGYTKEN